MKTRFCPQEEQRNRRSLETPAKLDFMPAVPSSKMISVDSLFFSLRADASETSETLRCSGRQRVIFESRRMIFIRNILQKQSKCIISGCITGCGNEVLRINSGKQRAIER